MVADFVRRNDSTLRFFPIDKAGSLFAGLLEPFLQAEESHESGADFTVKFVPVHLPRKVTQPKVSNKKVHSR